MMPLLICHFRFLYETRITELTPGEDPQLSELTGLFVLKPESVTATKGLAR